MKHIQSPNSRSTLTNVEQKDIQPNAVDLRVSKFFRVSTKDFVISEDQKTHRGSKEIEPDIESAMAEKNHVFTVKKNNQIYQVVGRESIKI